MSADLGQFTDAATTIRAEAGRSQRSFGSAQTASVGVRLRGYLRHHLSCFAAGIGRLGNSPGHAIGSCLAIGLMLAVALGLVAIVQNARNLLAPLSQLNQISIYLNSETPAENVAQFEQRLRAMPELGQIEHVAPDAALAELKRNADLEKAIATLATNPLPHAFVVLPKVEFRGAEQTTRLRDLLSALPDVDAVTVDLEWVTRWQTGIAWAYRLVGFLAALLVAAIVFNVANTIRLAVELRRDEAQVQYLVGATRAYVRRPYLYMGLWLGVLGSLLAWWAVNVALYLIRDDINPLLTSYVPGVQLQLLGWESLVPALLLSALAGWLGAFSVATGRRA